VRRNKTDVNHGDHESPMSSSNGIPKQTYEKLIILMAGDPFIVSHHMLVNNFNPIHISIPLFVPIYMTKLHEEEDMSSGVVKKDDISVNNESVTMAFKLEAITQRRIDSKKHEILANEYNGFSTKDRNTCIQQLFCDLTFAVVPMDLEKCYLECFTISKNVDMDISKQTPNSLWSQALKYQRLLLALLIGLDQEFSGKEQQVIYFFRNHDGAFELFFTQCIEMVAFYTSYLCRDEDDDIDDSKSEDIVTERFRVGHFRFILLMRTLLYSFVPFADVIFVDRLV
jgi:hypothetical protein